MTTLDQPSQQTGAEQPGKQAVQAPVPPGKPPAMTNVPGLPPTALSMQMSSLNEQYAAARDPGSMVDPQGFGGAGPGPGGIVGQPAPGAPEPERFAQSSLQDLAEKMAKGYGLNFGRGSLVDAQGNFLTTPDQLAGQTGDQGDVAAQMNYIAQAINDQKIQMQARSAEAALQTGLGEVQRRGRGSLAALQSNFYQNMAAVYTDPNLLPEQQDFSFWIQKEQMDEASSIRDKENKENKLTQGGGFSSTKPYGGAGTRTQTTFGDPTSTTTGPQGKGDIVTTGPHAGQRPVYSYDPINKTTTVTWE